VNGTHPQPVLRLPGPKRAHSLSLRNVLSLCILVALGVAAVASMLLMRKGDTALRVVGHEWERIVEVEAYTGQRWLVTREARSTGTSLDDQLTWPKPRLRSPGQCDGCEREGRRRAAYTVRLFDPVAKREYSCTYPEQQWRTFALGSRYQAEFGARSGAPDCASLTPVSE
jgi:hypothetical protein